MEITRQDRRSRSFATPKQRPANPVAVAALDAADDWGEHPAEWPPRPHLFPELLTPIEAAQYLRLDEAGQRTPKGAVRSLNHWRGRGELKATKYARRVWYRKAELDRFLVVKTEQ